MHAGETLSASGLQICFAGAAGFDIADGVSRTAFAQRACNVLKAYTQGCAAQSVDRQWSTAELVVLTMAQQGGAAPGCERRWPTAAAHPGHGLRSVMLPVTSTLANTPVFATYGITQTAGGGQSVDMPVLFISGVAWRDEPVASRREMVETFAFLSHTWAADPCLHQAMAAMSTWMDRRFFAGCTLDKAKDNIDLTVTYVSGETSIAQQCRTTADLLDIMAPRSKGSEWVTFHAHKLMARKPKIKILGPIKGGEAVWNHHISLASAPTRAVKCPSQPDKVTLPPAAIDDDLEGDSPFSVENMRLVFLGKRKPKACTFG
jgi:hypothetical protein